MLSCKIVANSVYITLLSFVEAHFSVRIFNNFVIFASLSGHLKGKFIRTGKKAAYGVVN